MKSEFSIIIPARNESVGLQELLPELRRTYPEAEIIVVNDASTDDTAEVAERLGASIVDHPYRMGNGAAIKSGVRRAKAEILVCMDADGQHSPADIERLVEPLRHGYYMVVGARSATSQASLGRRIANGIYNSLASYMTGRKVPDLTSGFRACRTRQFRRFLYLLPNGFSYPTTITMAFFRSGYPVAYVPIVAPKRSGKSHIKVIRDGIRFLVIIFRVGTLYSPLKLFFPVSLVNFGLALTHYVYTYVAEGRFTNMSALLFMSAVFIALIGLVSEQITNLLYSRSTSE